MASNLCDLFAHSLASHPQNLAVDNPPTPLTYSQLAKASSLLAATLTASGVGPRSPVLLITSHSTLNVVAILAILKAGGCFVPIDRGTWSEETVRYVCSFVPSPVIVNTTGEDFAVPDGNGSQRVLDVWTIPDGGDDVEDAVVSEGIGIGAEDPACIIFTSGSTGRPKGVVIPHAALCLYATTSPLNLDIAPGDRFLHVLSVAFDACACMLFSTLAGGGTVVPCLPEDVFTKAPSCTVMAATPSILSSLPTPSSSDQIFANMHTIILGGETASPELLASWVDAGVRVLIGYGVTETTSTGCIHTVERDASTGDINPSLIGGSMSECPVWLVDEAFCPVEDDFVDGEIVIAGAGLATGYYKDEAKTAEAFFLWSHRNQRVYRTGDYGRWVPGPLGEGDRVLEFRGRKDRTVKNRGFLVNLDRDVEEALLRAGKSLNVRSVVAMAVAAEEGIVAVVTPASVDVGALLARASQGMSAYCLPTRIRAVDHIPLSSNGKVQHRRILEMFTTMESNQGPPLSEALEQEDSIDQPGDTLETVLLLAREVLRYPAEKALSGDESFVSIGGSSLSALKMVGLLRQRNLHITVRDFFSCRTLAEIAHTVSPKPCEEQVQSHLDMSQDPPTAQKLEDLRSQARSLLGLSDDSFEVGPLTSFQLDLAMPTLLDECKSVNQVKLVYAGAHASTMERAWRAVWRAGAVFRTEICLAIGCGAQIVHRRPFRIPRLRIFNSREGYEKATAEVSMDVGLGCRLDFFALHPTATASAPSLPDSNRRVSIPGGTEEMTVVLTAHHSLIDGVSLKIILDRVELTAQGRCLDASVHASSPWSSSSSIHANLGLMEIQKRRDAEARSFFANYLKDVPEDDSWTNETRLVMAKEQAVKTISMQSSVSSDEVAALASRSRVSPACVYYTAWAMAIASLQHRENPSVVVVGAVFSNRACQPEFEDVIGPFMSTLPLVIKLSPEETVASCLKRTMDELLSLGEYAWVRADQVGMGRRLGNLLAMQLPLPGEVPGEEANPPPLRVESSENSDFPLSLLIEANGRLRVMYDTAMFEEKAVRRLVDHFKHSVHSLLYEDRVGDCVKISQLHERVLQRAEYVRSQADDKSVKQALERSIDRFAENIALEDCRGTKLTYREIDRLTNTVAHHINEALPPDAGVVAIYGDGTTGWILGLLGILKTGRTFVPLDPKWPLDRRVAVCETSGAAAILFPAAEQSYEAPSGLAILSVDSLLTSATTKGGQSLEERLPDMACDSDSDLVIVFTSGTTGTPKGIPISNRAFLALQSNPEATMFAAPGRRIAQFMSPAFDYCNVEIFSALLHGAALVLRDPLDPYAHLSKVNTVTMTPSVLAVVDPNDYPNLEVVFATGEAVTAGLVDRFAARSLFFNAYGPAECCICTSFTRMVPGDAITIGTAIDTARMYILDDDRSPAPDGVRGELYLAGVQVLRGYINAPEQSVKHILPDPRHKGERMYRTGDYGMRARDGRITYLGRVDRQVKIRGFRVELAGVEHAIMSGPRDEEITQCASFAVNGTLAACLAFGTPLTGCHLEQRIGQLKDRLEKQLLPSWVPQVIFSVQPPFPKTVNGKVDTKALEALYAERMALTASRTSASEPEPLDCSSSDHDVEGKLAVEWRRILQLEKDVKLQDCDDFFSLGGHSVLIMLLSTRLAAVFRIRVTARELLPRPTFRSQVQIIQQLIEQEAAGTRTGASDAVNGSHRVTSEEGGGLAVEDLTELEQQVWFQYQVATKTTAFNIANILNIQGNLDIDRLMEALDAALASDPVLRSNLVEGPHGPKRRLRSAPPTARLVKRLNTNAEVNHRFDLEHDELIRVHLVLDRLEVQLVQSAQLVIVTSHCISDLGTLQNLLELTSTAYKSSGSPVPSCAVARHDRPLHLESTRWKRRPSSAEQDFWRKYLAGHGYRGQRRSSSKMLQRPFPSSPLALATFRGSSRTREFQGRLVARLTPLMKRLGVTHHQIGIAAAALLLHWLSGEQDIVLGAPNANRTTPLEREALGQFLDRLPIRVTIPSEPADADVTSILTRVRDSSRLALAHAIPFSSILDALNFPGGALHHPLFDCMVTFHPCSARLEKWLSLPSCEISSTPMFAHGAKFPLMLEWFELGPEKWSLHIEYATGHMDSSTVDIIEDALEIILDAMGEECALSELRLRLADLELPDLDSPNDSLVSRSSNSRSNSPRSRSSEYATLVERMASTIQGEMAACLEISGGEKMPCSSSFFAAGADSTAVVALRHRMQQLGFDVPMRAIFEAQSALRLAEYICVDE